MSADFHDVRNLRFLRNSGFGLLALRPCREHDIPESWAVASATGRSSANERHSPFMEYGRAGNVTFWPPLVCLTVDSPISPTVV